MLWLAAVVAGLSLFNTRPNSTLLLPPYPQRHCMSVRQFLFYDGNGKLLYRGGVDGARAQASANTPLSRLVTLLDGRPPPTTPPPIRCPY